jgi:hypothetical protein
MGSKLAKADHPSLEQQKASARQLQNASTEPPDNLPAPQPPDPLSSESPSAKYGLGEKSAHASQSSSSIASSAASSSSEPEPAEEPYKPKKQIVGYDFSGRQFKRGSTYSSIPTGPSLVAVGEAGEWISYNTTRGQWEFGDTERALWRLRSPLPDPPLIPGECAWPPAGMWELVGADAKQYYGKERTRKGVHVLSKHKF